MENNNFSVSQINSYLKKKFNMDPKLKNIQVKGELSNYKSYANGHDYFTLKDENSQIKGVLYKGRKRNLEFEPKNGMKVIIKGSIEVYEKNGYYQLKANTIKKDGIGDLYIAFEKLKKKLQSEGLFDKEHKKEIPKYPKRIGVITAKTGAAIKDIITTINRRYPQCEIYVFSTLVQGDFAAPQIVSQLKKSQKYDLDTIIIGRGGGSIEDLWPFNEEIVAREIFDCKIPIISAVGHETDFTISDFAADLRAPTPTAAAELAVPQTDELNNRIYQISKRLTKIIENKISNNKERLDNICKKQIIKNPESIYDIKQMHLDQLINNLDHSSKDIITKNKSKLQLLENNAVLKNPKNIYENKKTHLNNLIKNLNYSSKNIITENKNKLEIIKSSKILKNPNDIKNKKEERLIVNVDKLSILNPLLTLKRGYSIAKSKDKVIKSVKDVESGDEVDIKVDDGTINTKVI
ncbi:exodeoxyribonuclease VII large subunit [Methanobrevibacter sp.]|uniref:exodeoxyribonuclease VII large subunit n=1 Tax=Methanobrevibacter sp. TaxID=66852 RepID=UPI0038657D66